MGMQRICKMAEVNIVLSVKSAYPAASCILCHLPPIQADSIEECYVGATTKVLFQLVPSKMRCRSGNCYFRIFSGMQTKIMYQTTGIASSLAPLRACLLEEPLKKSRNISTTRISWSLTQENTMQSFLPVAVSSCQGSPCSTHRSSLWRYFQVDH